MLVLSLIYILNVLNKLIGSIYGEGKQTKTQGNMFVNLRFSTMES